MEALLNYFYWQTLGINAFDQVGHVLRIALLAGGDLRAVLRRSPTRTVQEKCNSWLGPYQPGVTTPDPTERDRPARDGQERRRAARERERRGEPRRAGDPEAQPKPGERDLSQAADRAAAGDPRTCSTSCRGLPGGELPDPRAVDELGLDTQSSEQLLDYLLAP